MVSIHTEAGNAVHRLQSKLAREVVDLHYSQDLALAERYGPRGYEKCVEDADYHLSYLAEALLAESATLFTNYVQWAESMLTSRNIPVQDLVHNLRCLRAVVARHLEADTGAAAASYVDETLQSIGVVPHPSPAQAAADEALRTLRTAYVQALLEGQRAQARRLVIDAVETGTALRDIYLQVFQWAQHEIGRLWQLNRITVAQEHFCTAATRQNMGLLTAYFPEVPPTPKTLVMTCVSSEQHDMGAQLIADFFEMEGWRSYYLGANLPLRDLVSALKNYNADLLGISATMTFHLQTVSRFIDAVRSDPSTRHVKIIVGGYPFNVDPDMWYQFGADGCAHSAEGALKLGEKLVG